MRSKKSCKQKDMFWKKLLIIIFKGFIKQPVIKQSPTFFSFFRHWLLYECYFPFLIKAFADFEKLIRFHRQAFIVYKNGENLKIFRQKAFIATHPFQNPLIHPWNESKTVFQKFKTDPPQYLWILQCKSKESNSSEHILNEVFQSSQLILSRQQYILDNFDFSVDLEPGSPPPPASPTPPVSPPPDPPQSPNSQ